MNFLLRTLIAIVLSIILFASCSKTVSPTQAQLIAARLKKDIRQTQILSVSIYFYVNGVTESGTGITINEDGTIVVPSGGNFSVVYSLEHLTSYYINGGNLNLFF